MKHNKSSHIAQVNSNTSFGLYLNKTNGLPLRSRRYIIENFETVKKSNFFYALLHHQSYKWIICLFMSIRNVQLYGFNFPNSILVFLAHPCCIIANIKSGLVGQHQADSMSTLSLDGVVLSLA